MKYILQLNCVDIAFAVVPRFLAPVSLLSLTRLPVSDEKLLAGHVVTIDFVEQPILSSNISVKTCNNSRAELVQYSQINPIKPRVNYLHVPTRFLGHLLPLFAEAYGAGELRRSAFDAQSPKVN